MTKHPLPPISKVEFTDYHSTVYPKSQIYLHHTASGPNPRNVWNWWKSDKVTVGTCVVIGKDGEIVQGFSSKHWAHHLGLANKHFGVHNLKYRNLDQTSIGIEICNWGQLTKKGDKFYNYVNGEVPAKDVCELETPFKGFKYYEEYSDAQIESVRKLLLYWKDVYNIPLTYNEDIWDISLRALKGEPGVYTHNSVRKDKVDVYPSKKLIAMLKSLS
jgi:N-acetyl-anhydromuramyl-L-alanine amidase AmpD